MTQHTREEMFELACLAISILFALYSTISLLIARW